MPWLPNPQTTLWNREGWVEGWTVPAPGEFDPPDPPEFQAMFWDNDAQMVWDNDTPMLWNN